MQKEFPRENTGKLRKYMTSEVKLKNLFLDAGCKNNTENNMLQGQHKSLFIIFYITAVWHFSNSRKDYLSFIGLST